MEGDRTLPGVAFVAASGRAFFVFKVLLCCYFACFLSGLFYPWGLLCAESCYMLWVARNTHTTENTHSEECLK